MNIKEILSYWKEAVGLLIVGSGITYSFISYAEDQKQLIRAERALIHNELYQEGRISRKRDTIQDNLKFIEIITNSGNISIAEQKQIDKLEAENIRLEADIEEIRAQLATAHE